MAEHLNNLVAIILLPLPILTIWLGWLMWKDEKRRGY